MNEFTEYIQFISILLICQFSHQGRARLRKLLIDAGERNGRHAKGGSCALAIYFPSRPMNMDCANVF